MTSDKPLVRGALEVLRQLADRLESHLDGDPEAFETLGESLDQGTFTSAEVEAALMVLRSLHGGLGEVHASVRETPGRDAHRIQSAEERGWLSPEAWTYLMRLRRLGALDPEQFERVLGRLSGYRERPVGVDLAGRVAAHVVLRYEEPTDVEESRHDDLAH